MRNYLILAVILLCTLMACSDDKPALESASTPAPISPTPSISTSDLMPDGLLAYVASGELWLNDFANSTPQAIASSAQILSLSPDQQTLLYADYSKSDQAIIMRYDISEQNSNPLVTDTATLDLSAILWSPDSQWFMLKQRETIALSASISSMQDSAYLLYDLSGKSHILPISPSESSIPPEHSAFWLMDNTFIAIENRPAQRQTLLSRFDPQSGTSLSDAESIGGWAETVPSDPNSPRYNTAIQALLSELGYEIFAPPTNIGLQVSDTAHAIEALYPNPNSYTCKHLNLVENDLINASAPRVIFESKNTFTISPLVLAAEQSLVVVHLHDPFCGEQEIDLQLLRIQSDSSTVLFSSENVGFYYPQLARSLDGQQIVWTSQSLASQEAFLMLTDISRTETRQLLSVPLDEASPIGTITQVLWVNR